MSKLRPVDDCVIVEIEKIDEKSKGGIQLLDDTVNRDQMLITEGILHSIGDLAFYDLRENGKDYPKLGSRVFFKKYSGILHSDDENEKEYRIINDQDIYAYEEITNE